MPSLQNWPPLLGSSDHALLLELCPPLSLQPLSPPSTLGFNYTQLFHSPATPGCFHRPPLPEQPSSPALSVETLPRPDTTSFMTPSHLRHQNQPVFCDLVLIHYRLLRAVRSTWPRPCLCLLLNVAFIEVRAPSFLHLCVSCCFSHRSVPVPHGCS